MPVFELHEAIQNGTIYAKHIVAMIFVNCRTYFFFYFGLHVMSCHCYRIRKAKFLANAATNDYLGSLDHGHRLAALEGRARLYICTSMHSPNLSRQLCRAAFAVLSDYLTGCVLVLMNCSLS